MSTLRMFPRKANISVTDSKGHEFHLPNELKYFWFVLFSDLHALPHGHDDVVRFVIGPVLGALLRCPCQPTQHARFSQTSPCQPTQRARFTVSRKSDLEIKSWSLKVAWTGIKA